MDSSPQRSGGSGFTTPRTDSLVGFAAPEDVLHDIRQFVGTLGRPDRIALGGFAAVIATAFLPWRSTASEGELLGLVTLGFLCVLASIVGIMAIAVRVKRFMPRLSPLIPWLSQLAAAAFSLIWCFVYIKLAADRSSNLGVAVRDISASASFGVYLAVIASFVALAGTLLGLKEKPH